MTKLLLTAAIGSDAKELLSLSEPTFAEYASRHGYRLHVIRTPHDDRPPSWQKVPPLLAWLFDYEWILWVDVDAMILRPEIDVAGVLAQTNSFQAFAPEFGGKTSVPGAPNAGVWLVRGSDMRARAFLRTIDCHRAYYEHHMFEQAAIHWELGYTGAGNTCFMRDTTLLDPRWNDVWGVTEDPFVRHFAGLTHDERMEKMRAATTSRKV